MNGVLPPSLISPLLATSQQVLLHPRRSLQVFHVRYLYFGLTRDIRFLNAHDDFDVRLIDNRDLQLCFSPSIDPPLSIDDTSIAFPTRPIAPPGAFNYCPRRTPELRPLKHDAFPYEPRSHPAPRRFGKPVSKTSGAFFDLRPDIAAIPEEGKTAKSGSATSDYHARGYDYGRNFTLNICAPVADPIEDVVGLGKDEWKNVSAYYTYKDEVYSIGQTSLDLQSHGRMLVLQYTGGSPCGADKPKENNKTKREDSHDSYKGFGGEKLAEATDSDDEKKNKPVRRKSATLSFHCEPEQLAGQIGVSFVSTDPEECAYFFEIRSAHACARAEPHQPGSVGPGSVFAIIFAIAVLVYFGGGVFYNRTVEHARGWRQLPNYTLWAGIWNFICDVFYAALSLCARLLPGRRGYSHLAGSPSRSRNREDENRLIDQLDEEWDD
ncbi:putative mannose 6-phosphate receptor-like protein like [Verticillium longisporum]|uniref:Putative mannose 6-phosphate receptor-like protein like n=1 Tax=Verticillium longisporum TaxID=100787 RepID=A0A8I2ZVA2_VERLO|nr:putative mannose 6-phosphate receptor-like protein like [Verticillium longisporum]